MAERLFQNAMSDGIRSDDCDNLHEACGVFGCVASKPWPNTAFSVAADVIYPALTNLQHRGQESAGIVTSTGDTTYHFEKHRKMGLVTQIFTKDILSTLNGNLGLGHTRYSTYGTSDETHCQPFLKEMIHGWFAVAHNGQLVNADKLKRELLLRGNGLSTASDTELIAQILCQQPDNAVEVDGPDWVARICNMMKYTSTAYSVAIMHKDSLYAVRDPIGNRPLAIGKLVLSASRRGSVSSGLSDLREDDRKKLSGWVIASESCCFQAIGAEFVREVIPGEVVQVSSNGVKSLYVHPRPPESPLAFCIFEYVYFARPDSIFEGQMVYEVRRKCGRQLAVEASVPADIVSTVPDSATPAALGFAQQQVGMQCGVNGHELGLETLQGGLPSHGDSPSGVPYAEVLYKNGYIGRTFIKPSLMRNQAVDMKFGALISNVRGKRIILIDDSIVRGTTMQPIVALLRRAGALEVHIRIASPPLHYPCYMGINIPTRDELIANHLSLEQLALHVGADSVVYLSLEGLVKCVSSGAVRKHIKPAVQAESNDSVNGSLADGILDCRLGGHSHENGDSNHTSSSASVSTKSSSGRESGYCVACLNGDYPVSIDW